MSVIILLIGVSLPVATGFLISFLWNLKSGQYDDTDSPAARILFDDTPVKSEHITEQKSLQRKRTKAVRNL